MSYHMSPKRMSRWIRQSHHLSPKRMSRWIRQSYHLSPKRLRVDPPAIHYLTLRTPRNVEDPRSQAAPLNTDPAQP